LGGGCGSSHSGNTTPDAGGDCEIEVIDAGLASTCGTGSDPIQEVYDAVDPDRLASDLRSLSGSAPVHVCGKDVALTNRYTADAKQRWRHFFKQSFAALHVPVQDLAYPTAHYLVEPQGHNLEALIAGDSPDSLVIIVHYDSMG